MLVHSKDAGESQEYQVMIRVDRHGTAWSVEQREQGEGMQVCLQPTNVG